MRGIVLTVTMILTLYIAGMYRNLPLLVIFFAELFAVLFMKIIVLWFSLSVSCRFERRFTFAERGGQANCTIAVTNRSMLPVVKLRIKSVYKYFGEGDLHENYIYGAADRGETRFTFRAGFNYAGMVTIKIKKITLYDYLSIFGSEKKTEDEFKAAVFPENRALDPEGISQDMVKLIKQSDVSRRNTDNVRDAREEIRQVREYGYGDSARDIHWNLSARMDLLWVREYDDENSASAEVFLDLRCENRIMDVVAYDSFFCILTYLLMGMLRRVRLVRVNWYGGSADTGSTVDVFDYESCCDMLLMLYGIDFTEIDTKLAGEYIDAYESDEYARKFWFDTQLNWKINGTVLHRFDPLNWENELSAKIGSV